VREATPTFTKEEYNSLLALLRSSKVQNNASRTTTANQVQALGPFTTTENDAAGSFLFLSRSQDDVMWILDSGETDHICCSLYLFSDQTPITLINV
jgi:hypothetical protein